MKPVFSKNLKQFCYDLPFLGLINISKQYHILLSP